jgi:murein L,D-transpeptidase YcbB/YkuD
MKSLILLCFSALLITSCTESSTNKNEIEEEALTKVEDTLSLHLSKKFDSTLLKATNEIRYVIENRLPEERFKTTGKELYSSVLLPDFYVDYAFSPVWIKSFDNFEKAYEMIDFILELEFHGFIPEHYHLRSLLNLKDSLQTDSTMVFDPNIISSFDLLLTDAYFMTAAHLYHGKVDPESLKAEWGIQRNKKNLEFDEKLKEILDGTSVKEAMQHFYPDILGYDQLVEKAKYLKKQLPNDFQIKIPKTSIPLDIFQDSLYNEQINKKLFVLGFSKADTLYPSDSLKDLFQAIKSFQYNHGLNTDGKIGPLTYEALNTPLSNRMEQIYTNMERLRWLPEKENPKKILVNIADFTLDYMNGKDTIIHMRTVVGKNFRQTPVFNSKMTYLVFSPTWTVPPGILRNDVLPEVAKNRGYLASKNMQVIDLSGNRIDPSTIDWQKARKGSFPYLIRQMPGNDNALGHVKFMFPNKYSVYLHDTPSRSLFSKDERIFSSGCIRVEKPQELARLLLNDTVNWSDGKISAAMNQKNERTVILKESVDVYIYYLTSWSHKGNIHFRKDVYSRDDEVFEALQLERK